MKLSELAENLGLKVVTGLDLMEKEIACGYCGDLLSDVIANAEENDVWITLQVHQNIVAVAVMKSLAAIILIQGREPNAATKIKAHEENLPILVSQESAYLLAGKMYQMGIKGR